MANDHRFLLTETGHRNSSREFHYPRDISQVMVGKYQFNVNEVTQNHIILTYLGSKQ